MLFSLGASGTGGSPPTTRHVFADRRPEIFAVKKKQSKRRRRETNVQRREREKNRRTTLSVVQRVAELIRARRKIKEDLQPEWTQEESTSMQRVPPELTSEEWKEAGLEDWTEPTMTVEASKRWRKIYTYLGQVFCEICNFEENPAEFLRLVADRLEEKPAPYSPADHCGYDSEIKKAYRETLRHLPQPVEEDHTGMVIINTRPSFSAFLGVFRKQNPTKKRRRNKNGEIVIEDYPSDRSLRRSLQRLGYRTRPDKRGRPKKK